MNLLNISGSPHVHSDESTKKIMWRVNLALVPMLLTGIAFFGLNALLISIVSVACCCLFQWLIEKFILKVPSTVCDGSAVVTGLLLAFNVPATADMIWLVALGALVAIGVGKMSFGGLGKIPFNPALVGRVFMLISFPVQMTTWPTVGKWFPMSLDTVSGATPLGVIKEGLKNGQSMSEIMANNDLPSLVDIFLGHMGGSFGEVCALAILIGAIYLLCCKIISWHIPVAFIGTAFICYLIQDGFQTAVLQILSGGLLLGAFFMATDYVTCPMSGLGRVIMGIGCGLLLFVIRSYATYVEGCSFAILFMNVMTPLIDRFTAGKLFGEVKKHA